MPTQAQINLAAYKAGVKPEQIQAQLQAKGVATAPVTSMPASTITSMPVRMTDALIASG